MDLADLVPVDDLAAAHARLCATVDALPDARLAEPSPLAGWTRSDVLTHLARAADAYRRLLAHARGEAAPETPTVGVREDLRSGFAALTARGFALGTVRALDLDRRWELGADGPSVTGTGHALPAWLSGRSSGGELGGPLPEPPAWPLPPARGWS